MRIQHNIMAMNSYRNLSGNSSKLAMNLEKLSSGYKINRAGDDAAGLAISEKMRAQITGLDAAQKNVKDGISLVKTAEGALQEVHDMMNRMVYLAEQSANGTYDNNVDRKALNEEVSSLKDEMTRISLTANFNGMKLLDGSLSSITLQIGDTANAADQLNLSTILGTTEHNLGAIISGGDLDVSTTDLAKNTINSLRGVDGVGGMINQVSELRGKLGAVQNRLEHTSNNLGVMKENIQDAEANIRDTDVADEMMAYTKNNILIQSAQAMLAQANQAPQGVLQLLQ